MLATDITRVESNISFCTFRLEDINVLIEFFLDEKKKAAEELKKILEQASLESENGDGNGNSGDIYLRKQIVKNLKKHEYQNMVRGDDTSIFEARTNLSFSVTAGNKTLSGNDWHSVLSNISEPVNAILMRFECADLKRKIVLTIKEHNMLVTSYRNKYEIIGANPEWVNEAAVKISNKIENCNNNRKHWYEMSSFLEPIFSFFIAGSLFFLLRFLMLVLHQDFTMNSNGTFNYLQTLLIYVFIWLFLAVGLTTKLSDYLKGLYPSVEIFLSEEKINKRKRLIYLYFLIALPYILHFLLLLK